jgi:hypothetical protein
MQEVSQAGNSEKIRLLCWLRSTRVEQCASADGDEQKVDEQIKICRPTGTGIILFVTEKKREKGQVEK